MRVSHDRHREGVVCLGVSSSFWNDAGVSSALNSREMLPLANNDAAAYLNLVSKPAPRFEPLD